MRPIDHVPIDDHIRVFPIGSISFLAPYTGLILSVVLAVFFLIKFYILELFLLKRIYGEKYTKLDEINRRGFVNHHIAGATKIVILIVAAYPFLDVAFGSATFHTPFTHGSKVTMGDILVICAEMLIGMFILELIYRVKISPVSVVHHLASILIGQAAITISVQKERDSSIEFVMCTVWGAFDIISEFLPHLAIILYRVHPDEHHFLAKLFRAAFLTTLLGTISETIVAMYLFGQLWPRWTTAFRVSTPILHIAFSVAQLHGTRIFYTMWKKQERILHEPRKDTEIGMGDEDVGVDDEPEGVERDMEEVDGRR